MFRRLLFLPVILLLALPAAADPVGRLADALQIDRLIGILRDEGLRYGGELEQELFPGSGGTRWAAIVSSIHARDRMRAAALEALREELAGQEAAVETMSAFFETELGARIVGLELTAREGLLEPAVKDAAELAWEDMVAAGSPRVRQLERFAEVNDLIEQNVAGALNANLAFWQGMLEAGASDPSLAESEMLADLWSQEPQIRQDMQDWLFPYLALAYQPLEDSDLAAYIAFSDTEEGRILNAALFSAFDRLFAMLSRDLGFAAARFMQGEDI
ncbi:MAG: hypothetical protein ACK4KW_10740 [Gemmobacter sp.]